LTLFIINLFIYAVNVRQRKSKFIFEVQFNSTLIYEALASKSDGVKFIACNFMLNRITIIALFLEYNSYNSTDFPSHQS